VIKAVLFDCFGVVLDVMRNTRHPDTIALLADLKGRYTLAMVSNVSSRRSLDDRFLPGELDDLFEVVLASGDVGFEKPSPHIFTMAAEKLQVKPEECLFVDDIETFCRAAETVGMQSFHFTTPIESAAELRQLLLGDPLIDNPVEKH
jgi:FMN phosphatase YigB (HAD superfamily)